MNSVSETSSLRAQLVQVILCLAVPFMAVSANAAEYSEAHDIPAVTSVLFTASSIALAVDRDSWGYRAATRTTYFIADRDSYSFQEVSEQEFNSLTMEEHVQSSVDENANSDINLLSTDDCKNKGYHYDSSDHEMTGRRIELGVATPAVVAAHEFGHAIGFSDAYKLLPNGLGEIIPCHETDIMGPSGPPNQVVDDYHGLTLLSRYN